MPGDEKFLPTDLDLQITDIYGSDNNFASEEDTTKELKEIGRTVYDRYASDREPYETIWKIVDNMYKSEQNRTLAEDKMALPDSSALRSTAGSTLFYRTVNQFTAHYMSVYLSKPLPFKYYPIMNSSRFESSEEARQQAENHDIMARWALKRGRDGKVTPEMAMLIYKYGGYGEMVFWNQKLRNVKTQIPQYIEDIDPTTGEINVVLGEVKTEETLKVVDTFPEFRPFPIWNLYVDPAVGEIQDQNWVFLVDVIPLATIINGVRTGEYDPDQVKLITEKHFWDGAIGGEHREDEQTAEGLASSTDTTRTGMFLRWNVFCNVPIDDSGKWDAKKNSPEAYWFTSIGNAVDESIPIKLEKNRDPDGEVPISWVNCMPGEPDTFYRMAPGQAIRSNYAVESTLKNQILDEQSANLLAPLIFNESAFPTITDFTFDGSPWPTDSSDPDKTWSRPSIGGNSQGALGLLGYIRDDSKEALAFDRQFTGEGLGSRASASEANNVFRLSSQPPLNMIRYIMSQREYFRARKIKSYMEAFGDPEMIIAVTDDSSAIVPVSLGDIHGEFDIEINIVDEFQDNILHQQSFNEMVGIISQSPELLQRTDMDEMLRAMWEVRKLPGSRFVKPPQDFDAKGKADEENRAMMTNGTAIEPIDGQNHNVHLVSHRAELMRWAAVEGKTENPMAANIPILRQHVALTEQLAGGGAGGGSAPVGDRNQPEGPAVGNALAGPLGALAGGQ